MAFTGGCQCGKIRYRAEAPRDRASVCYCRMCQKASGAPFMAFVRFPVAQVSWSSEPAYFASSNLVERGFCRDCGTPLTYHQIDGEYISLTLNSLDNPALVQPEMSFTAEARAEWLGRLEALPCADLDMPGSDGIVSYQREGQESTSF